MDEKKVREAIELTKQEIQILEDLGEVGSIIEEKKKKHIELYNTVIEALEKQLAKKIADRSLVKDNGAVVGFIGRCPSCNEIIDDTTTVCDCGQKIDWSE